jgi:formyl-CoA transferase
VLELGTLIAAFAALAASAHHPSAPACDPLLSGAAWHGESLWHLVQSRGKRSVTADLHDPRDQALVRALAVESDVLIENFRPGRLEAWNLDPAALMAANPGLIVVRISGYGQTGPTPRPARVRHHRRGCGRPALPHRRAGPPARKGGPEPG